MSVTKQQAREVVDQLVKQCEYLIESGVPKPYITEADGDPDMLIVWQEGPVNWAKDFVSQVEGVRTRFLAPGMVHLVRSEPRVLKSPLEVSRLDVLKGFTPGTIFRIKNVAGEYKVYRVLEDQQLRCLTGIDEFRISMVTLMMHTIHPAQILAVGPEGWVDDEWAMEEAK